MLSRRHFFLLLIFLLFSGLVLFSMLLPMIGDLSSPPLSVGDVAPYDIHAPYAITFDSQILTASQQETAAAEISPVYSPVDTSIARQQLEKLHNTLVFINNVRADAFATQEQKTIDLSALEGVQLSLEAIKGILSLSEIRWQDVSRETTTILDQLMREPIRENNLTSVQGKVPNLVSLSFSEEQSLIIVDLVQAFLVPNSLYNAELTDAARQAAKESVTPVARTYVTDETIIQGGRVISITDYEALQQFGLAQPRNRWQDIVSAVGLTILTSMIFVYSVRKSPILFSENLGLRRLALLLMLFLVFLIVARVALPGHAVIPYAYPVAAFALTISAVFSAELALISVIPLTFLIPHGLPDAQVLTLYYILGSLFGIFILKRAQRLTRFFWAGAAISITGGIVAIAYRIVQPTADWIGLATLSLAAIINGIASASITLILHYYFAQFLGQTTALQLIELSRPDQPLQQLLLRNAPGTYQHSLQLANLVEQAAEAIGANAMLARVGALYHDIGKILNPYFFIENQLPGNLNPHNDLDPETSAATIIRHIPDGMELAHKYRLPRQLIDFIEQHHGTTITRYQYSRALDLAQMNRDAVDISQFRYPGPKPCTPETGLLMLADTCEARMRAEKPKDELDLGELDDTPLTLKNLEQVIDSFTATLRGVYHPRIQYPKSENEIKTRPIPYRLPDPQIPSPTPLESTPTNDESSQPN
jgi:putative nucleotidyltransferase with HDIG domain